MDRNSDDGHQSSESKDFMEQVVLVMGKQMTVLLNWDKIFYKYSKGEEFLNKE